MSRTDDHLIDAANNIDPELLTAVAASNAMTDDEVREKIVSGLWCAPTPKRPTPEDIAYQAVHRGDLQAYAKAVKALSGKVRR